MMDSESQSLPSLQDCGLDEKGCSTWRLLLSAEAAALKYHTARAKYRDDLIGVRVVGFFLLDFRKYGLQSLGSTPYNNLRVEIDSCLNVEDVAIGSPEETAAQHEKVYQLGLGYRNFLMRVFRSNAGPIPTPSQHVSRPSFDRMKERILESMKEAPKTKKGAKDVALFRDGYRCAITGLYDMASFRKYPEVKERALEQRFQTVETQCAHLFSESAQDGNKPEGYAATAFAILERFGLGSVVSRLLGGQVNSPCNTLTLADTLHSAFDRFEWWLEEVKNEPNTYDVRAPTEDFFYTVHNPPRRVVLKVDPATVEYCLSNGQPVPELPDSRLIAVRAACARVAHLSGAAEHIEEIIRDCETTMVLADDGGSTDLLFSLLRAVDVRG